MMNRAVRLDEFHLILSSLPRRKKSNPKINNLCTFCERVWIDFCCCSLIECLHSTNLVHHEQ